MPSRLCPSACTVPAVVVRDVDEVPGQVLVHPPQMVPVDRAGVQLIPQRVVDRGRPSTRGASSLFQVPFVRQNVRTSPPDVGVLDRIAPNTRSGRTAGSRRCAGARTSVGWRVGVGEDAVDGIALLLLQRDDDPVVREDRDVLFLYAAAEPNRHARRDTQVLHPRRRDRPVLRSPLPPRLRWRCGPVSVPTDAAHVIEPSAIPCPSR